MEAGGKPTKLMKTRECTDEEIESQVKGLESLQGGSFAAAFLVGCGERAIAPLRSFLMNGRPRGIYQPRQLAVETLAELGATDVLLEYLENPVPIKDAVVRMGEDAVRSTAARELGRWPREEVFRCLMRFGSNHLLPGVIETLGKFRRLDTLPYFLWALGDGVCRSYAEDAIRALGEAARPVLVEAVNAPEPSADEENASSIQRRRRILRILADLKITANEWGRLRNLLAANDPDMAITTCRIALDFAPEPDKWTAVHRLIEMLPHADWFLRTEARTALVGHYDIAQEPIQKEIERRIQVDGNAQALDVVLRLLVNLRSQAVETGFAKR